VIPIDLSRYGKGNFNCRGTLQSKNPGDRLLLLFGERHSLKPFIRDTLLNTIELDKLGVLSCVGMEGCPSREIPGSEARRAHEALKKEHGDNDELIVEGMLRAFKGRDFYFWKTLVLMRPDLKGESVDDKDLCEQASGLEGIWCSQRYDQIRVRLEQSDLFGVGGIDTSTEERNRQIQAIAKLQFEQEWGEHPLNVARDRKMIENLMVLWDQSWPNKIAVLNAGSSHLWRIARQLPTGVGHYHIEQP
jgi:hypothetical protein